MTTEPLPQNGQTLFESRAGQATSAPSFVSRVIAALPYCFLAASAAVFFLSAFWLQAPLAVDSSAVLADTNATRLAAGLPALHEDPKLDAAAGHRIADMVAKQYFAHVSPDGIQPWDWIKRQDYPFAYAGENLAINYQNAHDVVSAWLHSPEHKANLLNPVYQDIGVSVQTFNSGGRSHTLVVELYGAPKNLSVR